MVVSIQPWIVDYMLHSSLALDRSVLRNCNAAGLDLKIGSDQSQKATCDVLAMEMASFVCTSVDFDFFALWMRARGTSRRSRKDQGLY